MLGNLFAQLTESEYYAFDSKYGKSTELYKGIKYALLHKVDFGNPFFYAETFLPGKLTYKGNVYKDVELNYDLFEQKLLLKYQNLYGAINHLVLLSMYVDSFSIGQTVFVKNIYPELSVPFIRLCGNENGIQCLFTYEKDYGFNSRAGESGFGYSKLLMKKYLLVNGKPCRIKGKTQFIKQLPDNKIKERCRTYLKMMKWNFRKMDDSQLSSLCNYLNASRNE